MVVRFVCVIRVPVCARVSRVSLVCPLCVPCASRLPGVFLPVQLRERLMNVEFLSAPTPQTGAECMPCTRTASATSQSRPAGIGDARRFRRVCLRKGRLFAVNVCKPVSQSVSYFTVPPRAHPSRLAVRLRHSRSNTSTEYSLPGATQLSQVRSISPSGQGVPCRFVSERERRARQPVHILHNPI